MAFMDIKAEAGRFDGVLRPYTEQDVQRLRGSVKVEHTLAQRGAEKLWQLLKTEPYVHALGALSGNQVGPVAGGGRGPGRAVGARAGAACTPSCVRTWRRAGGASWAAASRCARGVAAAQ